MMVLAQGRGWGVICKYFLCSKATGRLNIQTYCQTAVSEHKLSHQLGHAGVTHIYQRPRWWVREDLSEICPSNPRGKWNIVAYCFR